MGIHVRVLIAFGALGLTSMLGCSADPGALDSDEAAHTEVDVLTLDNVFLEHAHPAYWEPGDPRYVFPVAARIFYGFRPYEEIALQLSDTCRGHVSVEAEGEGYDAQYTLWCAPDGDETRSFSFTTESQSFGQEEQAFDVILGTSFGFIATVALERVDPHHYVVDVQPPADEGQEP
ncbi:MAG: hypothetical protein JRI23_29500 [Deltaproteobacteria bacterium]|jgi:hypothetical protein|nr:hypothetical protein [Deltaproteobacteria bacterium]MBW2536286.1 hypothetical protein [Deltaproteobacteria bacterium]